MEVHGPSMGEGASRFWTVLFAGVTAASFVAAGIYTLVQYFDLKEKDRATLQLQIAATTLAAKQSFNSKRLELCSEAAAAAGTIASSADAIKKRDAEDTFWRLYWGPLGIVEEQEVAGAMVAFGNCLKGSCSGSRESLALGIAHACRAEISRDFKIDLGEVPDRPLPAPR